MNENSGDDIDEINMLSDAMGIPYRVCISQELSEHMKPNAFLSELGIQYLDRVKLVLGILKGNMIPKKKSQDEILPKRSQVIPLSLVKGPYITEEIISIKAEITDDGGKACILLTALLEEEE
jgi:hypothetical protein